MLQLLGAAVLTITVVVALLYAGFMVIWMHAPPASVLLVTMALAALPLAVGWGLFKLASRAKS